jgi:hypothetical protein
MREEMMETQETRTERLTITLTPSEMNDARLVAAFRNTDLSNLLRDATLAEIDEQAKQIRNLPLQQAS